MLLAGEVDQCDDVADPAVEVVPPASAPEIVNGSATFSVTSSSGIRLNDWKTKPVRSRRSVVASSSLSRLIVAPSRTISPEVGRSSPPRSWSSVDLPEPDGPIRATNSPSATRQRDASQGVHGRGAEAVPLGQVARLEDGRHRRQCSRGVWAFDGCDRGSHVVPSLLGGGDRETPGAGRAGGSSAAEVVPGDAADDGLEQARRRRVDDPQTG